MRLQSVIGILIGHVIVKPIWDKINESLYRQELSRMYKSKAAFHFLIKIYSFALKWVAGNSSVFRRCFWGSPCSCRRPVHTSLWSPAAEPEYVRPSLATVPVVHAPKSKTRSEKTSNEWQQKYSRQWNMRACVVGCAWSFKNIGPPKLLSG